MSAIRSFVRRLSTERTLNRVTLIGRIGADAQLKGTTASPVVQFSLATSNYNKEPEWHKVSVFKPGLRNLAEKFVKCGSRVYVEGSISYGSIRTAQNVEIPVTSIIADDIVFLSKSENVYDRQNEEYGRSEQAE